MRVTTEETRHGPRLLPYLAVTGAIVGLTCLNWLVESHPHVAAGGALLAVGYLTGRRT